MTLPNADSSLADHPLTFNRDDLVRRLGGDEQTAAEILELFLADLGNYLLDLKSSVDAAIASAIRAKAHALKGASANIGAQAIRDAAAALEKAEDEKDRLAALYDELAVRCEEFRSDSKVKELLKRRGTTT